MGEEVFIQARWFVYPIDQAVFAHRGKLASHRLVRFSSELYSCFGGIETVKIGGKWNKS